MTSLSEEKNFSLYSWNLSQSALLKMTYVRLGVLDFLILAARLMTIGRWSELSRFHLTVGIKLKEAMLISGAVEALVVTLVGWSLFITPLNAIYDGVHSRYQEIGMTHLNLQIDGLLVVSSFDYSC